jgi:DNA-binding NarL/FixJ family response regulator
MDGPIAISLILADDHAIVRDGIAARCRKHFDVSLLGQFSSAAEALDMIHTRNPDFAILNIDMPGLTGLQMVRRVRQGGSGTRLIALSVSRDQDKIRELLRAGLNGYVLKDSHAGQIPDAINSIREGWQYLAPLCRRDFIGTPARKDDHVFQGRAGEGAKSRIDPLPQLSRREFEVYTCLVRGQRPKDIAESLELSPKTVDTYRAKLMRKLAINSVAGLVRFDIMRSLSTTVGALGIDASASKTTM